MSGDMFEAPAGTIEIAPELRRWYDDDNAFELRYSFNLNSDSIVFDVGGYDGYWSKNIHEKYGSYIYLFEPVTDFYTETTESLSTYPKIKCFNYGIGGTTCEHIIYLHKDGSNIFRGENDESIICQLKSIDDVLAELNIHSIDLMKINAEGVEYDILERLMQLGLLGVAKSLLIQFHEFVENAHERKQKIEQELSKTHKLVFDYDFIWQKWEAL